MKRLLTKPQGCVLRALVCALGPFEGAHDREFPPVIVESFTSDEWISLTFAGHRHVIALVVPGTAVPTLGDVTVTGQIVAEAQIVTANVVAGGVALTARMMTVEDVT